MEEEARIILRGALSSAPPSQSGLGSRIRQRFAEFGGVDLPQLPREAVRDPPVLVDKDPQ